MKKIDLSNPTDKQLKTGYLNYNTSMVVQLLQNFCKSPEGANAGVMLVLPDGRNPMQKERVILTRNLQILVSASGKRWNLSSFLSGIKINPCGLG